MRLRGVPFGKSALLMISYAMRSARHIVSGAVQAENERFPACGYGFLTEIVNPMMGQVSSFSRDFKRFRRIIDAKPANSIHAQSDTLNQGLSNRVCFV